MKPGDLVYVNSPYGDVTIYRGSCVMDDGAIAIDSIKNGTLGVIVASYPQAGNGSTEFELMIMFSGHRHGWTWSTCMKRVET